MSSWVRTELIKRNNPYKIFGGMREMKKFSYLFQRDGLVRRFRGWFLIGLVFLSCLAIIGCGGGSRNDNNITVTVSPGEVTLQPGDTQQFSATVTGTANSAVTWSVEPQANGGSLDSLHPGKYQAPLSVGTYYVVATSQADSTKFGKAKVNVVSGGYTVSGQVTVNSAGLQGVTLAFSNGAASVTTDASGNWSKPGLSGTVTVTPSLAGCIFSPATITVSTARSDVNFTATRKNIAYIYLSDDTAAKNFKALLGPTYLTDLILKSNIESTIFTKYSLIIIDRVASVLTDAQATAIHNTNLPVIGISVGGLKYFEKIGLNFNGGNVSSNNTTQAIVINAALPIWSFPNALNVSNGSAVTIYSSATQANTINKSLLNSGEIHIAGYDISNDTIAQTGINLYWAYYNDASAFTETGRKLFMNAIAYMTR